MLRPKNARLRMRLNCLELLHGNHLLKIGETSSEVRRIAATNIDRRVRNATRLRLPAARFGLGDLGQSLGHIVLHEP
jgi:hypothetical protein